MTVPEADEWGNMTVIGSEELKEMVSPMDSLVGYYLVIEGQYVNDGNQWNTGVVVTTNDWNYYLSKGISGWGDDDRHDAFDGNPISYKLTKEMSDALLNGGLTINQGNHMEVSKVYFAKSYTIFENEQGVNGDFTISAEDIKNAIGENVSSVTGYKVKITMLPTADVDAVVNGFQIILKSSTSGEKIVGIQNEWGQEWINKGTTTYTTTLTEAQSSAMLSEGLSASCDQIDGVGITSVEIIAAK